MSTALSPREEEAVLCVAEGLTHKEIARVMGIAIRTADSYVEQAIVKLGARNRMHLVALCYERGILVKGQVTGGALHDAVVWLSGMTFVLLTMFSVVSADPDMLRARTRVRGRPNIQRVVRGGRRG